MNLPGLVAHPVTVPDKVPFANPPADLAPYERACQLLRSVMPHEIAEELFTQGHVDIKSKSGRIYRLSLSEKTRVGGYPRCMEFVSVYKDFNDTYSAQLNIDRIVMEYVLIRYDEQRYLATAAY